jgi:hypothetical protein
MHWAAVQAHCTECFARRADVMVQGMQNRGRCGASGGCYDGWRVYAIGGVRVQRFPRGMLFLQEEEMSGADVDRAQRV